jgi:hypothetical protein
MLHINFAKGTELPPFWFKNPEVIKHKEDLDKMSNNSTFEGVPFVLPLSFKFSDQDDSQYRTFPIEPIVSVNCKNIVTRRNVAKKDDKNKLRGTIKESWSQDDYEITIAGIFMGPDGEYPEGDVMWLRSICEAQKTIDVKCPLFTVFNITKIVIENFDFPFTKGTENQVFTIKAYSDDSYDLLIEN